MITLKELRDMRATDIAGIDPATLPDISSVTITGQTPAQRLDSLLTQVNNPYIFRVGQTPVRISFRDDGPDLSSSLSRHFKNLKH